MSSFISEPITPLGASFDAEAMSPGEPGLPQRFRWRKRDFAVTEVLGRWKDHGDCRNGSGERYVRKHGFRVRTEDGTVFRLYFQRSVGRGRLGPARWWVLSVESCASTAVAAD
jgi:hypothetical protein